MKFWCLFTENYQHRCSGWSHTYIYTYISRVFFTFLDITAQILQVLGEKGEFSHYVSALETSIKKPGSSKIIMKGIITFQASRGAAELQDNYASKRQMHNDGINVT